MLATLFQSTRQCKSGIMSNRECDCYEHGHGWVEFSPLQFFTYNIRVPEKVRKGEGEPGDEANVMPRPPSRDWYKRLWLDSVLYLVSTLMMYYLLLIAWRALGPSISSWLKLHPGKCQLAFPEFPYLGCITSTNGISPNPDKVRAVKK